MLDALVICAVGALAGAINALAGGGTLLTFPALVWLGRDPVVANATNALALWPGSLAGAFALRSEAIAQRKLLARLAPVSMLGGMIGGYALLVTPARVFDVLVPVLVGLATFVLAMRKRLASALPLLAAEDTWSTTRILGLCTVQFFVSIYGGYFGAAMGILMLASLGLFGISDIHARNGVKNVLAALVNGAAGLYFVAKGAIDFIDALLLGASAVLGAYAGARMARRFASHKVERVVLIFGAVATLMLAYRALTRP